MNHQSPITVVVLAELEPQLERIFESLKNQSRLPDKVILLSNMEAPSGLMPFEVQTDHNLVFHEGLFLHEGHLVVLPARSWLLPDYIAVMCEALDHNAQAALALAPPSPFQVEPVPGRRDPRYLALDEGYHPASGLIQQLHGQRFIGPQLVISAQRPDSIPIPEGLGDWGLWLACHYLALTRGIVAVDQVLGHHYETDVPMKTPDWDTAKLLLATMTEAPYKDLLQPFAFSGASRLLGFEVARVIQADDAYWKPEFQMAFQHNFFELGEYQRRLRFDQLAFQSDDLMTALRPRVSQAIQRCLDAGWQRVAFYGVGLHTRYLIDLWNELAGPPCMSLITTEAPQMSRFHGLPVSRVHDFDKAGVDAVVFSSKSLEKEMAESSRFTLGNTPRLALWDDRFSYLPDGVSLS